MSAAGCEPLKGGKPSVAGASSRKAGRKPPLQFVGTNEFLVSAVILPALILRPWPAHVWSGGWSAVSAEGGPRR